MIKLERDRDQVHPKFLNPDREENLLELSRTA